MPTTPVCSGTDVDAVPVVLPPGYVRVWTGPVCLNDRYLHCLKFQAGEVEWVRLDFAKILQHTGNAPNEDFYDKAEWYVCLIRERDQEVGVPCRICGVQSPVDSNSDVAPRFVGMCWACIEEEIDTNPEGK